MNMMPSTKIFEPVLTRTEAAGLVSLAARTVAPIWPLESAIAVNPLSGFEDRTFTKAVKDAAARFGANESLSIEQWRALLADGKIEERALRDAAIHFLGGLDAAVVKIAPDIDAVDLLMARLLEMPAGKAPSPRLASQPAVDFVAKWCAAFFDEAQATSTMPHRDLGLYRAVIANAAFDPDYRALTGENGRKLLLSVPRDPLDAIVDAIADLSIQEDEQLDWLSSVVALLPGWAGHIRWRNEYSDDDIGASAPAGMADLIAIWALLARAGCDLSVEPATGDDDSSLALLRHFQFPQEALERFSKHQKEQFVAVALATEGELGGIFMQAAEWTYQNALVPRLQAAARKRVEADTPAAQLVFCIDVRSEPFRRAIEAQGNYETLGYAGFFGLPIAYHPTGEAKRKRCLPVLLSPRHDIAEQGKPGREAEAAKVAMGLARERYMQDLFGSAKQGAATAFATAEATGPLAALLMAGRTVAPRLTDKLMGRLRRSRAESLAPDVDKHPMHEGCSVFSLEEKVGYAATLFRLTGLTSNTARLVVLTGHGGSAVNNPFAAALDCGACGGHAGGVNARVLTAMLNDPEVRKGLADQGLAVPATAHFLAAQHNTTTDEVEIYDAGSVPESHRAELESLETALALAASANRKRRAAALGRSPKDLLAGALHWGEVRPEWGLAGNAGFIAAPRSLTQGMDLEGRAFLHSYDWKEDPDGTALTTILTAPMVVAQWINCQYLFSTIDNDRYGSGDKVTHNVLGGIGVVQGNGGDLRIGLPRQSLFSDDGKPFHIPQRLLTVVLAPLERVQAIVEANDILGRLFGNGWVKLAVIDPETGRARLWRSDEPATRRTAKPPQILNILGEITA